MHVEKCYVKPEPCHLDQRRRLRERLRVLAEINARYLAESDNQRLREALTKIADNEDWRSHPCRDIARAALDHSQEQGE